MRLILMVGGVLVASLMLSGCVGGGYAFSDTYHGTIYENPVSPPPHPASRRQSRDQSRRYHARSIRHHRSIGYEFGL